MSLWNVLTGQNKETPGSEAATQEILALQRRTGKKVSDKTKLVWKHSILRGWYLNE